jgi:DNA-binding MarR family transcriptional regulator
MQVDVATRLRRIAAKLNRELNDTASDQGLTPTQAVVLNDIVNREQTTIAELVAFEGLNPTMLSRVVTHLVNEGLVRRIPDPNDGRSALFESTKAGAAISKRIIKARTAMVSTCFNRLQEDEAESIRQALPALEALVRELQQLKRANLSRA